MRYNAVLRGITTYYYHVDNRNMLSYLNWILLFSAAFTLSRKLNLSPAKIFKKYGNRLTVKYGEGKKISLAIPSTLPVGCLLRWKQGHTKKMRLSNQKKG